MLMFRVLMVLILHMNVHCVYLNWTSHDRPNIVVLMSDAFVSHPFFQSLSRIAAVSKPRKQNLMWAVHWKCCLTSVCFLLKDGRLTFSPGNKVVQLPYINYMREMGAVFLNSYTNSPICCPSRAGRVLLSLCILL